MTHFSIVTLPEQSLRQVSQSIDPHDPKIPKILPDLERAMVEYKGVGIAGCQVGLNERIFLVHTDEGVRVFLNATITGHSLETTEDEEGCLSVPGVYGMVKRYQWVDVEYDDENGTHQRIRAMDFFARVIQHETDHTNGTLFVDRASKFTRGTPPVEPGKKA